jgi:hypothetical protein
VVRPAFRIVNRRRKGSVILHEARHPVMRLLPASTAVAGIAAAPALALRADLLALVLLAAWCGLAWRPGRQGGRAAGPWIRLVLALALAVRSPGWPAAALVAALLLEGAAVHLSARAAARRGIGVPRLDLHTLVLAGGRTADLVAALAFAAMILLPEALAPVAGALAGLTAMGAIARASLVVAELRGARDEA